MTTTMPILVGFFSVASIVIILAATFLTNAADIIASRMGLGRLWVGSLLLAGATSLPELATAISAVLTGSANLAAGNMFGANMLNMSNLAILLALFGGHQVFQRVAPQQVLVASSAIAITGLAVLLSAIDANFSIFSLSIPGVTIIMTYVIFSGILRKYSSGVADEPTDDGPKGHSLTWAWTVFLLCTISIFIAGPILAISADGIAELTGIGTSFMGVLALALVTTLPELTTTFTALRMGAHDMAIANMFGTNSFNIAALGIADLFNPGGSLFPSVNSSSMCAGIFAITLMALGTLQLIRRRPIRIFSLRDISQTTYVIIYGLGLFMVFSLAS